MMIWQNIKMAFASLRQAKLRSLLTILGIVIGVSSVVSVIAIGNGLKNSIARQVESFGTNLVMITPGQIFGSDEGGGGFNLAASLGASTLTESDIEIVRNTDNVRLAAPFFLVSGVPTANGNRAASSFIVAATADLYEVLSQGQKLATGQFLQAEATDEAVLGHEVADKLFGTQEAVSKTFDFRGRTFRVVGVLGPPESEGFNFGFSYGDVAYIPFATGKELAGGVASIMEIDVHVIDASKMDETKQSLRERLKAAHGGEEDFTVATPDESLAVFSQIMNALTGFVAAIAGISLLVGGIGIMNIMLVSVTERTREIGIRKAIGAARWHILTQFLTEALTLSLVGGLLGIALAYGETLLAQRAINISPVFSGFAFGIAFGVSALVGIVFGIAPAIKAARKKPIEALRYE